jgi:hypothetical protein
VLKVKLGYVVVAEGITVATVEITLTNRHPRHWIVSQTPQQLLAKLPLVYSLCPIAQTSAAQLALAAAQGQPDAATLTLAQQRQCLGEMIGEHLWRLWLDWPEALQLEGERALLGRWYPLLRRSHSTPQHWAPLRGLLGMDGGTDFPGVLGASWRALAQIAVTCPPDPSPPAFCLATQMLAQPQLDWQPWCLQPTWQGEALEVGAWSRQAQHCMEALPVGGVKNRLQQRWLARWLDLKRCLDAAAFQDHFAAASVAVAPGEGVGVVETARGPLLHYCRVNSGRLVDYAIAAPTEWNFHPNGVLVRELTGQNFVDLEGLRQYVDWRILALDPCVPWQLTLEEVGHA